MTNKYNSDDNFSTRKLSPKKTSRRRRSTTGKQYKPCKSHQYRDPVTHRCRNKTTGKQYKPCKSHQYRDPVTHRCRKKTSRKKTSRKKTSRKKTSRKKTSRKKTSRKKTSRKKTSRKTSRRRRSTTGKQYKPCKSHQYRDPVTNRCRNKTSRKKTSRKKTSRKKTSRKTSRRRRSTTGKQYKPCKSHQYRDPVTNRCRNKTSRRIRSTTGKQYKPCKSHQYRDPVTNRCRNKTSRKKTSRNYEKPFYIFRNMTNNSNEYNNTLYTKEQAFNMFIENIPDDSQYKYDDKDIPYYSEYKDDDEDIIKFKEYVKYAYYSLIYIIDPDDEDIYNVDKLKKYSIDIDDDFKQIKKKILNGYFFVDAGHFGYRIMAILPDDNTLKNNDEKLAELKFFIHHTFFSNQWLSSNSSLFSDSSLSSSLLSSSSLSSS